MLVPNTEPSRGSTQHATPCGCRFRQQHKPVLFFGQRCWLSTLVAVLCTVVLPFSPLTHRTSQSRYTPALVTMSTVWIRQEREKPCARCVRAGAPQDDTHTLHNAPNDDSGGVSRSSSLCFALANVGVEHEHGPVRCPGHASPLFTLENSCVLPLIQICHCCQKA